MGKVVYKGIKENGLIDAEVVSTPILVTQLISKLPALCEAEVCKALEEIRESAEMDDRHLKMYARILKEKKKAEDTQADHLSDFERKLINGGIDAVKRCVDNHDMDSVLAILHLCKAIGGDKFSVELVPGGKDEQ